MTKRRVHYNKSATPTCHRRCWGKQCRKGCGPGGGTERLPGKASRGDGGAVYLVLQHGCAATSQRTTACRMWRGFNR